MTSRVPASPSLNVCWSALIWGLVLTVIVAGSACRPQHYKEKADNEVYEILKSKHEKLYQSEQIYEIERLAQTPLQYLPRAAEPVIEIPRDLKRNADPPLIVSLEKSLEIASFNNRDYQTRKENVYLTALALTEERHMFSNQFDGLLSIFWDKTPNDETISGVGGLGVSRMLKTGAQIGLNLSTEFLRHLTGDPRRTASSILAVSILQPLWRGAGEKVAAENLKQAERNVIYAIRAFARFKKTFTVSIASFYYRVLQQRAVVRNERRNFQDLFLSRDRAEILAKAGRLPEFQADQAKQDELRAKDRWILAVKQYFELLDRFKIELGLPTDTNVDLDDADLDALLQTGINLIPISLEHAVALALENRQDLKTDKDRVADARRKVYVAENNLGPDIDMVFEATVPTEPETKITKFQFNEAFWNAGVDLDLALERLSERNAFRSALIVLDRTQRDYSLKVDEVKRDVREAWRTLQQTRDSYVIRKNSVDLAMRRVDSTTLLLKAGRADTRDLLESQSALVEAENALVRTLTDHTIARLDFLRDTGLLTVTDKLLWQPFDDNI